MTPKMTLAEAEAAYREAWEADRREGELRLVRAKVPSLEKQIARHKERIAELEASLAELTETRALFVQELASLPEDTRHLTGQEEDEVRARRKDLRDAIAALDGDYADGTLVGHLWNQPRIPGTGRLIAEERDHLARVEAELTDALRQLND